MSQSSSSATGSRFPIRELKRIPEDTDDIWCNEGRPNRTEDNNSGNAGEICVQAVETQKMVLGLERPDTLFAMHNLAVTYWFQGQYNDAEKLGVQVVQCQKRILGLEHPDTLSAMENLGQIYSRQERWKEAEELEVQVLEARKTVLGLKHPDTLLAMHHLALIFESRNRKDDALLLMRECHELSMQNLGEEHPCTKSSLQALNAWTPGDHEAIKLAIRLCTIPRT
jgi:tetratricopeptide (TPR) repeat protein